MGPEGAATILIVGNRSGFTVITMLPEVTVTGLAQGALEVNVHVMISPLFKVVDENVFELPPTFIPFTFH